MPASKTKVYLFFLAMSQQKFWKVDEIWVIEIALANGWSVKEKRTRTSHVGHELQLIFFPNSVLIICTPYHYQDCRIFNTQLLNFRLTFRNSDLNADHNFLRRVNLPNPPTYLPRKFICQSQDLFSAKVYIQYILQSPLFYNFWLSYFHTN